MKAQNNLSESKAKNLLVLNNWYSILLGGIKLSWRGFQPLSCDPFLTIMGSEELLQIQIFLFRLLFDSIPL